MIAMPLSRTIVVALIVASSLAWGRDLDEEASPGLCVVATGLGGLPEFDENFSKWADSVEKLCGVDLGLNVIRLEGSEVRRADFLSAFNEIAAGDSQTVWMFLIGHGNFDGEEYKFNIKGPDLKGSDLALFLKSLEDRSVRMVVATSSSGVLVPRLKGANRVIITATRGQSERLAPLFMSFFLEAATSAEADQDKNGTVSLSEAFAMSEAKIGEWYENKKTLQTEHPILDDEGGSGRLAASTYLSKPPEQAYRSLEARRLMPERVRLQREVEELKLRKPDIAESEYYERLEQLLVELAVLNEKISQLEGEL